MRSLVGVLLYLRLLAVFRSLHSLGWWRLLLLLALTAWATFLLAAFQAPWAWLLTALVITGGIQMSRNDCFFLQTLSPHWAWLMRAEYALLALPFWLGMAARGYWQGAAALTALIGVMPYFRIPTVRGSLVSHVLRLLPAEMYEWKAGLRKNGLLAAVLWLISPFFYWTAAGQAVFMLLYLLAVGSFYLTCEPRIWLSLQNAADSRRFLWQKIKNACIAAAVGGLPFCIPIIVFHVRYAWLAAAFVLLAFAYVSYAVLLKYALYAEGRSLEPFMLHHFIFVIGCATIIMLPAAVYFWQSNRTKAYRHLSNLFSDA